MATTFYVDAGRPDDAGDGLSWATAKQTIQAAIDLAVAGDAVLVTNGVYARGARVTPSAASSNRVVITKPIAVGSVCGPDGAIILGSGPLGATAVRCAYLSAGLLYGFTLSNGCTLNYDGQAAYDWNGGSVNMYGGNGMVSNCVISGNTASADGGGCYYGSVSHCTISGNVAWQYGGGVCWSTAMHCRIVGNTADSSGGGAFGSLLLNSTLSENHANSGGGASSATISNCTLSANTAHYYGGAAFSTLYNSLICSNTGGGTEGGILNNCVISWNVSLWNGGGANHGTLNNCYLFMNKAVNGGGANSAVLNNCVIYGNTAEYGGGTYECYANNCTITENHATLAGGGAYRGTIRNCIVYYNSPGNWDAGTLSYCCTWPLPASGNNSTNAPRLLSASHIMSNSACVASGSNAFASGRDVDGQAWKNPPAIGCDEVYVMALTGTLDVAISAATTATVVGTAVEFIAAIRGMVAATRWTFGDGSTVDNTYIAPHAWATNGGYPVILRAFNSDYPEGVAATVMVAVLTHTQARYYVDGASVTPAYPYTSWATAARTIQEAIDTAAWGGNVVVTDGLYATGGRVVFGTWCTNRVVITTAITVGSVNGPDTTLIVGQGVLGTGAVRCVYMSAGTLTGFTLSNGCTETEGSFDDQCGGGVNMNAGAAMVSNCIITANTALKGGGVFRGNVSNCRVMGNTAREQGCGAYQSVLTDCIISNNASETAGGGGASYCMISNCMIVGNAANGGGGVSVCTVRTSRITGNSATIGGGAFASVIDDSCISANTARYAGGGAYSSLLRGCRVSANHADSNGGGAANTTVEKTLIENNTASSDGGGAWGSTVNNSIVCGNSAGARGGGTYAGTLSNSAVSDNSANEGGGMAESVVNNCTIVRNAANVRGGGTDRGSVRNAIVYYNQPDNWSGGTYTYCCTWPMPVGNRNSTNEPVLLSASHIALGSPCIGAGSNVFATGVDIDGQAWKNPPSVGCDEVYADALTGTLAVSIQADYTTAAVGAALEFSAEIQGMATSNRWTLGDGQAIADHCMVRHSWAIHGSYPVILQAFNTDYPQGVAATVMVAVLTQDAATYYVNGANATPLQPYTNWQTAATMIQDAVDAAAIGGQVVVTDGVYAAGMRATPGFVSTNRLVIAKEITVGSVHGAENTVILGQGPAGTSAVRCVYMTAGMLTGFTLSNGFTLDGGGGSSMHDCCGGGVNMPVGSAVVARCVIVGNQAQYGGGAAGGTLNDCTISGNAAVDGGGTRGSIANNCSISGNRVYYRGGGVYGGTVNNCTISGNFTEYGGGGTYDATVNNCTINRNSSKWSGGGAYFGTINNCTISGNNADSNGGGTYAAIIRNSIIWNNSSAANANWAAGTLAYCCTTPRPSGAGNFASNPLLVDVLHIAAASPCVGAGAAAYAHGTDINGEAWKNPPAVGCDEVYPDALTGQLTVTIIAAYTAAIVNTSLDFVSEIRGAPSSNCWTFGDATMAANCAYVNHIWSTPGSFSVMLTAFNLDHPDGVTATVSVRIVTASNAMYFVHKANPTPAYPYTSWATAAPRIQDAVDAVGVPSGAQVIVTNGMYDSGTRVTPGYASLNRVVISKNVTVRSVNGPADTVILGAPDTTTGDGGGNAVRGVYLSAGTLDGFTVSNGHTRVDSNVFYDQSGGGVNMYGGNGTLLHCVVTCNTAREGGGGVCEGTVSSCTISGNAATEGGGLYFSTVSNATISGNSAGTDGGGTSYCTVNNCTINNNAALQYYGGGTYGGSVNNCTISGNSAGVGGGGTDSGTINNCLIIGNAAPNGGGTYGGSVNNCTISANAAEYGGGTYNSQLMNCIVWYNTAGNGNNYYLGSYAYSCSLPLRSGAGNIAVDPRFVSTNDFHLKETSPCLNAATNLPWMAGATDLDGNARVIDGRSDMGCYESVPEPAALLGILAVVALCNFRHAMKRHQ